MDIAAYHNDKSFINSNQLSQLYFIFFRVHYQDKETVGTRLSLSGLAQAYQISTKYKGPMPTSISVSQSGTMTITYDNGNTPINVRNTWGFEVRKKDP